MNSYQLYGCVYGVYCHITNSIVHNISKCVKNIDAQKLNALCRLSLCVMEYCFIKQHDLIEIPFLS